MAPSVAVQVTNVETATGNFDPEVGEHDKLAIPELSLAVGLANMAVAYVLPASGEALIFAGHDIVGTTVSITETVNEQRVCNENWLVALHEIRETPRGKVEGEFAEHVTVGATNVESDAVTV